MCCLAGGMHENEQLAAFGVRLGGLAWEMSWHLQIGRHRLMESLWGVQREIFIAFFLGGVNQAVWWKRAEGAEARGSRLSPGRLRSAALARAKCESVICCPRFTSRLTSYRGETILFIPSTFLFILRYFVWFGDKMHVQLLQLKQKAKHN